MLQEKGTAAGRTEWFSPVPIDHRHYVNYSPIASTMAEGKGTNLPLLRRHPKGPRFGRSETTVVSALSSRCAFADYHHYP